MRPTQHPLPPGQSQASPTVLVVASPGPFPDLLRSTLEPAGYLLLFAQTGQEAMALSLQRKPAVTLIDEGLADIDGPTLVRKLRAQAGLRAMSCLLLASSEEPTDELRGLEAGADAYLRKGKETQALLSYLSALLSPPTGLPTRPPALAQTAAGWESAQIGAKRVLAVDDSMTYLRALVAALRKDGHELLLARSGEEALARMAHQPVDCVLLDLVMSGLGGRETCRRIKATPAWRDIPLLMMTANDDRQTMLEGLNAGADDYIAKSSDFDVLRTRLRAHLRRKHFEDEHRRIREALLHKELEATQARAAAQLAETRALLLADLERKNAELDRARVQALRESQVKSKFLANVSHELRTPLNAIIGFSELLEQGVYGDLTARQTGYVRHVLTSGLHLLNLVNDILDLSKIEAGQMRLTREWMGLGKVIGTVLPSIEPLAHKQGLLLEVEVPDGLPDLFIDPLRFRQILYNLLSNGIKFTPAGGRVRLVARGAPRAIEVRIEDTGKGIRHEDMTRLFKEFEQLEPSLGDKPDGTGLGLSLTKRLVELHDGTIWLQSEWGKGTQVTVSLPLLTRTSAHTSADPGKAPAPVPSLVLVVEEEPEAAQLIAGYLSGADLAVAVATHAQNATALASELKPAAIVLDLLLPRTDSLALLAELKKSPILASIPVVPVAAAEALSRGLILGATDFLVRPLVAEKLAAALGALGVASPSGPVSERTLLIVAPANEEAAALEEVARSLGYKVRTATATASDGIPRSNEIDLALVDLTTHPVSAVGALRALAAGAGPIPIPILGLVDEKGGAVPGWRQGLEKLAWSEASQLPDRLVRAIRAAMASERGTERLWDPETGLPTMPSLVVYLQTALERADRERKPMALVRAPLSRSAIERAPSLAQRLRPLLGPRDFVATPESGLLLLAAYDAQSIDEAKERLSALGVALGEPLEPTCLARFPEQGRSARALLAHCLTEPNAVQP